tara:strand:+ start:12380 stop:13741 length:1362 start_codon:yes stop_codon:yes gene_type:complete
MKKKLCFYFLLMISLSAFSQNKKLKSSENDLIFELQAAANEQILDKWYPLVLDTLHGGYYSDVTYDFQLGNQHDKMIVTQARHIWTNATAALQNPKRKNEYLSNANHGFKFLRDYMWDTTNGGFHSMVTKNGEPIVRPGEAKTAYGNSFAIYGLSTYYHASRNEEALDLAKKTFQWLEEHSHDNVYKGYYQSMAIDGTHIVRTEDFISTSEVGYKDQNSTIHLLEALTSLYEVWPNELVKTRIKELLVLIRDTITTDKGYMNLFFEKDWTPISFRNTDIDTIKKHYYMDHISFGHDVETAYLMLEASIIIGDWEFEKTLYKGKMMVDHAILNGWDNKLGGFYDGGYYFKNEDTLSIVNYNKNWWSQAEGLNSLLLMDFYFPKDKINYRRHFNQLWRYTNQYLMDKKNGGWYEWGQDNKPETKYDRKGHVWKGAYHNYRALVNSKKILEQRTSN